MSAINQTGKGDKMKKHFYILLTILTLVIILGICSFSAFAAENEVTGGTWGGVDWTFEITDPVTKTGKLTIAPTSKNPDELDIHPHTGERFKVGEWREAVVYVNGSADSIGGLPYNSKKVTELVIEEGVTTIGSFVAQNMPATGRLHIPSTVTYIGQETFAGSKFTELTFAENSQLKCLAPGVFKRLPITSVSLPEGLECMHVWVFQDCTALKYLYIPSTVNDVTDWEHVEYMGFDYKQTKYNGQSSIFTNC